MGKKYYTIHIKADVRKVLKTKSVKDDITMMDLIDNILVEALEVVRK